MYDYHTHSAFSDDSTVPAEEMVLAAIEKGILEYAITDHFDPDYPDPEFPFLIDFSAYHAELLRLSEKYTGQIKIIKGLEIGIQHGTTLDACRKAANDFAYDFILGSFHCAEGYDIYRDEFYEGRSTEDAYVAFYTYMLNCLREYKDYDVLSHFNIIDRYVPKIPDSKGYMDIVEEILKLVVYNGKGIEINTSSFRYGMGERTTPAKEILQLYVDLGGEIITTGSDAHKTADVGHMLDYAQQMILDTGFSYISTFENRRAKQIKIR